MDPPSLHICNLANVAYSNCKILNERGEGVRLLTHDIKHVMSQPEWQDLELDPSDFADEWNFYEGLENASEELGAYSRPEWYVDSCLFYPDVTNVNARDERVPLRQRLAGGGLMRARNLAKKIVLKFPNSMAGLDKAYGMLKRWGVSRRILESGLMAQVPKERSQSVVEKLERLVSRSAAYGKSWKLDLIDLLPYEKQAMWLDSHGVGESTVFGYVTSAIYPMILHEVPIVAVEIGTIRDLPFNGTSYGKTIAMMYREADHVLITNPDTRGAAERLGIERYSFSPHPVDEDIYRPVPRRGGVRDEGKPLVIFAPARQNWAEKGNDKLYRALAELVKRGLNLELHVPEWGQDLDRGRKLVRSLGIDDSVRWLAPQSEGRLIRSYQECDIVADQFVHGVFGLISPKAMACGCPVVTSYSTGLNSWCFPEDPPLLPATEELEIIAQLERLARDPGLRERLGAQSRKWVEKYHAKDAVYRALKGAEDAARGVAENRLSKT